MTPQETSHAADVAVLIILIGAVTIGLISMAIGRIVAVYDWLCAWWGEGVARATAARGVNDFEEPAPPPFVNRPVMSRSGASVPPVEPVRAGTKTTDTYQVRGGTPPPQETPEPSDRDIISRRMSSAELVTLLAVQQNKGGGYRYSKNQIAAFVGGTRAETLRLISEARGEAQPQYRPLDERSRPMLR